MTSSAALESLFASTRGFVDWGVAAEVRGRDAGRVDASRVLQTASIGKVFLLLALARELVSSRMDPGEMVSVGDDDLVADSGLWQHLATRGLPVADAAVLVAAVSDNLATNVLLRRLGLDRVGRVSADLGMPETRMTDRIRDVRTPADPSGPSCGSAADLLRLITMVGRPGDDAALRTVAGWLALGVDLSMVASAWARDPLWHPGLVNKTGTDERIRADVGVVADDVAYAVVANWSDPSPAIADDVMAVMRAMGEHLREQAGG